MYVHGNGGGGGGGVGIWKLSEVSSQFFYKSKTLKK